MIEFNDMVYGRIQLPDWIEPFIKLPEFIRLRDIRLSNVDSFQFKDLSRPTRWEHGIATAFLAQRCSKNKKFGLKDEVHLTLAALLHDVATPPFGHTVENLVEGYSHEVETQRVLCATPTLVFNPDTPIFESQLPQFWKSCKKTERKLKIKIDIDEIARMIVGDGQYGFLICGTLDLDNADNVIRACFFMGIDINRNLPFELVNWLSRQKKIPTDLESVDEPCVIKWLEYRNILYNNFYECSIEELGRQAFLEHLIRRAVDEGLPKKALIWSTDSSILQVIKDIKTNKKDFNQKSFSELVQRYKLVEAPFKLARINIIHEDEIRILKSPLALRWLEEHLSTDMMEILVTVQIKRYEIPKEDGYKTLFPPSPGYITIFKLGSGLNWGQLPDWLKEKIPKYYRGTRLYKEFEKIIYKEVSDWVKKAPWLAVDLKRKEKIINNLNGAGDWSFRLSKNESMHAYPSTFVHAIPATLISSLALNDDLIMDCFGGTGQTAVETIKQGGRAITSDINAIATLVAKAKLIYLSRTKRDNLRAIAINDIKNSVPDEEPKIPNIKKWFHGKTLDEMLYISGFIKKYYEKTCLSILQASFSAIITSCTARRGEQHGYFADNTPLAKGQKLPPYQDAVGLFLSRLNRNLDAIERLYAFLERQGKSAEKEINRAKVLCLDARVAKAKDYGIEENSAGAIITSPPYLCMADYTLGQRLSYQWLFPQKLEQDFELEIGPRRSRSRAEEAVQYYFEGLNNFAQRATTLLRHGGYIALVMGEPLAKAFKDINIIEELDNILEKNKFSILWSCIRPVQWHRNHGYSRLREERVSVHVFE